MTTDYVGATDAIYADVYAAWKSACTTVLGAEQKMFFQGIVKDSAVEIGAANEFWSRTSRQTVDQGSNGPGARKHAAVGLIFVQMFFPLSAKGAWRSGTQIATTVKNALARRSSSGTVWFRNPRINELTPDGTHHRLNVVAEFEYDEIV